MCQVPHWVLGNGAADKTMRLHGLQSSGRHPIICHQHVTHAVKEVHSLPRAPTTKYHRLGGLNHRNLFSRHSGGCKSKVSADLFLLQSVFGL